MIKDRAYFLLDAVLAVLILSILVTSILYALEISVKSFRRINEYIYTDNQLENVFCDYLVARSYPDLFIPQEQGSFSTPYGDFFWRVNLGDEGEYLKKLTIEVGKDSEIFSKGEYLFIQ
jgi:hypothetical protein